MLSIIEFDNFRLAMIENIKVKDHDKRAINR